MRLPTLSITRRLPLLISALIVAVVLVFSWAAYSVVLRALTLAAMERTANASQRLAGMLDESGRRLRSDMRRLAADARVVSVATRASDAVAVQGLLDSLRKASSTLVGVEVRDARDAVLARAGRELSSAASSQSGATPDAAQAGAWIGPLIMDGDSIAFALSAPVVRSGGDTLGRIVQLRRASSGQGAQRIGELIGTQATVAIGNASGDLWTDLVRRVEGPPVDVKSPGAKTYLARDGSNRIGAAAPIVRTPWVVWIDAPSQAVLAPARALMSRLALIAILILAAGTVGGWLLSRQITRPLVAATKAAEGIAAGDYSRRVAVASRDEVGQLAVSFNAMAEQVAGGRAALEARVEERTKALENALSDLHTAQAELVRREKLAILGQLAGGVGHELRNPLGVMTNALYYLDAVLRDVAPDVKEYLGIIRTQIALSEKIIGDLLDFARVKPPQRQAVPLGDLVADQLTRLGPLNGVTLNSQIPATLPPACIDRVQLGQVVLNLLTNAVQAMADKQGTLIVRAELEGSERLRLDVGDTGSGIRPDDARRIFEPLFTTKARGIGLGLAVSRSLVHANGGEITFSSEIGRGTTFTLRLPVSNGNGACTGES
ncbi:MAG: ATP-binding protein [Gemmatimonadaceae bacterium]